MADLPFHPLAARWFTETYGKPTAVQKAAWPLIAEGKNVLALAPTGSGKTLTAFLAALSRFIEGTWDPEKLSVLYVSPLKALNEDIRRNLLEPIEALKRRAAVSPEAAGTGTSSIPAASGLAAVPRESPLFRIRVETRSGDTPQAERRRFLLHPPSILAVTPESLAILLLNPRGREALAEVRCLVLDEIHAVMGTKRGAFLSCQVDRLEDLVRSRFPPAARAETPVHPGLQRIALSATVNPPELAAEFTGTDHIVCPPAEKEISFRVEFPQGEPDGTGDRYGPRYTVLVNHILNRLGKGGSILVFTGSRRRAERIAFLLNREAEKRGLNRAALCHHGSLSKEVRREVEQSLVRGLVPCVVATSSLELGLDIGAVKEVILAGTPASAAQTLQRIGRSGHGVGEESRGVLFPFHGTELVLGTVLAEAVADREIERIQPVRNPLDILCQIVLTLCLEKPHSPDELYQRIRGFYVFRDLARSSFDGVIAALSGSLGIGELKTRLYLDWEGKPDSPGILYAAGGTAGLLYTSGGVIPSRGLYSMRLPDGTKIGDLDEEFVWERRIGDNFDFGARSWKIIFIGDEAVTVNPVNEAADFQPFWKADTPFRSPELCRRTLDFFAACSKINGPEGPPVFLLPRRDLLSDDAAEALADLLAREREILGGFPDNHTIPVEIIDNPAVRRDALQVVFHTFRGGALNYPFALALSALLEEKTGLRIEAVPDDNAVLLHIPRTGEDPEDPRPLLLGVLRDLNSRGEALLRRRLETSGIFGAAFREAAERSLILPRGSFGKRIPLWVMRQRAKRLYDRTAALEEFPVTGEAWRTCLEDRFDMAGFRELAGGVASGKVKLHFVRTALPSPFARDLSWKETNSFMYEYDERKDLLGAAGNARAGPSDPIMEALEDPFRRPAIGAETAAAFTARLRREIPGYAPEEVLALAQWVHDRIAVPADEWRTLLEALPENAEAKKLLAGDPFLGGRIQEIRLPGASLPLMIPAGIPAETVPEETGDNFLARLGEWLRYEGPVRPERIAAVFGCGRTAAEDALEALVETGDLIRNLCVQGEKDLFYCDRENAGLLFRLNRKQGRPRIKERPAPLLIPFVALRQGLIPGETAGIQKAVPGLDPLEILSHYPAPVKLWETEFLPARDPQYRSEKLEEALRAGRILWFGAGRERAALCPAEELDLAGLPSAEKAGSPPGPAGELAAFCAGFRTFWEIRDRLADFDETTDTRRLLLFLWEEVWRGRLSSDSWESIRRGIGRGFSENEASVPGSGERRGNREWGVPRGTRVPRAARVPRAWRERWREGSPLPGRWYSLATEDPGDPAELSALEEEELRRDRVRLLLRRWGILCRPLLETEGFFSWPALLPAMRGMELAGELVTGRFFAGIPSLQFASPFIAEELERAGTLAGMGTGETAKAPVYWMNAADPASPSGWNIAGLEPAVSPETPPDRPLRFPPRIAGSRICFRGDTLAAVSSRSGKDLEIGLPPDDPALPEILAFLAVPRKRACHPVTKISLETVNGEGAAKSPYAEILKTLGFTADRGKLTLWQTAPG